MALVQIDPTNRWRRFPGPNPLLIADLFEQLINVRKVMRGHVLHERTHELFVSDTPIEPAHKQYELYQRSNTEGPPMGIWKRVHARQSPD